MSKSSTQLKKTSQRTQKSIPSLLEYFTHDSSIYPPNDNRFHKTLSLHRANALLLDAKKKVSNSKNLSSTINNNYTQSMSKQTNRTKSTRYKTSKHVVDYSSQEKIASLVKHDSTSLEKIDLSQIEKNYQEMLNEKDVVISKLRNEVIILKNRLLRKSKPKQNNLKESFDKNEEIKLSGKIFSDRLSNYYTPKARHLFRTINTNLHVTQHLKQLSLLSPVNNSKVLLQSNTLKSPTNRQSFNDKNKRNCGNFNNNSGSKHKGSIDIYNPKNNKMRSSNENALEPINDVPIVLFNANNTSNTITINANNNNNNESILNQLKQKTKNVLDQYYQLIIKQQMINKDKILSS